MITRVFVCSLRLCPLGFILLGTPVFFVCHSGLLLSATPRQKIKKLNVKLLSEKEKERLQDRIDEFTDAQFQKLLSKFRELGAIGDLDTAALGPAKQRDFQNFVEAESEWKTKEEPVTKEAPTDKDGGDQTKTKTGVIRQRQRQG